MSSASRHEDRQHSPSLAPQASPNLVSSGTFSFLFFFLPLSFSFSPLMHGFTLPVIDAGCAQLATHCFKTTYLRHESFISHAGEQSNKKRKKKKNTQPRGEVLPRRRGHTDGQMGGRTHTNNWPSICKLTDSRHAGGRWRWRRRRTLRELLPPSQPSLRWLLGPQVARAPPRHTGWDTVVWGKERIMGTN